MLPSGFRFAGVACGVKPSGKPDLALVVADQPCVAAGVYTQNLVRAASIDWNRSITPTDQFRGLVINSGNANACTGAQGETDNRTMAVSLANELSAQPKQIGVLSTGVIGHHLPMDKITSGIRMATQQLGSDEANFSAGAEAILTTDQSSKTAHRTISLTDSCSDAASSIHISAMAKGAGMIGPNMATMLAIITTDAPLAPDTAQSLIQRVANRSFNRISVEGHTSTNDALLLLASGTASPGPLSSDALQSLENALTQLSIELAKKIPTDGEGASHLIAIRVTGADSEQDADRIARTIAQSNLVKTAIAGGDPNWGRIVSAAGYSGVTFEPEQVSLRLNGVLLFHDGTPVSFDAARTSEAIKNNLETEIELSVGTGPGEADHWTSDLTVDYVRFNSEYTT